MHQCSYGVRTVPGTKTTSSKLDWLKNSRPDCVAMPDRPSIRTRWTRRARGIPRRSLVGRRDGSPRRPAGTRDPFRGTPSWGLASERPPPSGYRGSVEESSPRLSGHRAAVASRGSCIARQLHCAAVASRGIAARQSLMWATAYLRSVGSEVAPSGVKAASAQLSVPFQHGLRVRLQPDAGVRDDPLSAELEPRGFESLALVRMQERHV